MHNEWGSKSSLLRDLGKKGSFQAYIKAFQSLAPDQNEKIGSVFCKDCLAKCREKRAFTKHLSASALTDKKVNKIQK